jgi:hypothetical protein
MGSQGGIGLSPITWLELSSFDKCNGLELNGWEFTQLMKMSRAYCSWISRGSAQTDIADDIPWIDRTLSPSNYLIKQREESIKREESPL